MGKGREVVLLARLREVADAEGIKVDDASLRVLLESADWSMRRALERLGEIEGRPLSEPPAALQSHESPRSRAADAVQIARFQFHAAAERGVKRAELAAIGAVYLEALKQWQAMELNAETEHVANVIGGAIHG